MSVSYDVFSEAFLDKVTEYDFPIKDHERDGMIDRYMRRALSAFKNICEYDLSTTGDPAAREFRVEVAPGDIDELADIVSEGMLVQWMKPYVYKQENLENTMNTRGFSAYSPAELLLRISGAYSKAQKDFTNMMREYSYNHGDLSGLHL